MTIEIEITETERAIIASALRIYEIELRAAQELISRQGNEHDYDLAYVVTVSLLDKFGE